MIRSLVLNKNVSDPQYLDSARVSSVPTRTDGRDHNCQFNLDFARFPYVFLMEAERVHRKPTAGSNEFAPATWHGSVSATYARVRAKPAIIVVLKAVVASDTSLRITNSIEKIFSFAEGISRIICRLLYGIGNFSNEKCPVFEKVVVNYAY